MPKTTTKDTKKRETDKKNKNNKKEQDKDKDTSRKNKPNTPTTSIENQEKEQITNHTSKTTKIIIALIIIAIAVFFAISFSRYMHEKGTEDWCKEIEEDPGMKFRCKCIPLIDTEHNQKDTIDEKTKPICRCTCDIGNGTMWTTDIRQSL